jgi:hypothetical protein
MILDFKKTLVYKKHPLEQNERDFRYLYVTAEFSIIDIIGNNVEAPSRRFISSDLSLWHQPSGRFLLFRIKFN